MLLIHKGMRCGSAHVITCCGGWSTKLSCGTRPVPHTLAGVGWGWSVWVGKELRPSP